MNKFTISLSTLSIIEFRHSFALFWSFAFDLLLITRNNNVTECCEERIKKNDITGDVPTVADPTVADFRPSTQVGRFFRDI